MNKSCSLPSACDSKHLDIQATFLRESCHPKLALLRFAVQKRDGLFLPSVGVKGVGLDDIEPRSFRSLLFFLFLPPFHNLSCFLNAVSGPPTVNETMAGSTHWNKICKRIYVPFLNCIPQGIKMVNMEPASYVSRLVELIGSESTPVL